LRALLERVISIPASCPKILLDADLIIDTSIKGSLLSRPIPRGKQEYIWEFAT
jgi:hypothetical protein